MLLSGPASGTGPIMIATERSSLGKILDALPFMVMAVDADMRIIEFNAAAGAWFDLGRTQSLSRRGGDAARCVNAVQCERGCGHAPACRFCEFRGSVRECLETGRPVRRRAKLELNGGQGVKTVQIFVRVSPLHLDGKVLGLLIVEDIADVLELNRLVPICSKCKRIRTDEQYWIRLEAYFKRRFDMEFTHGYCPQCANEFIEDCGCQKPPDDAPPIAPAPAPAPGANGGSRGE